MDVQAIALAIASDYAPTFGPAAGIGDAALVAVLLSELRAGVHLEPACLVAGIDVETAKRWRKRGETEQVGPYAIFARAVNMAMGAIESDVTKCVIAAGKLPQYWTAAATYLERTHPSRWGKASERAERNTAAIEVHVHGIERARVLVGVTTHGTSESKQRVLSNELDGDALMVGQSSDDQVLRTSQAPAYVGSSGETQPRGPQPGPGSASADAAGTVQNNPSSYAVQTVEKNPSVLSSLSLSPSSLHQHLFPATTGAEVVRTANQETQKPLLTEATSTSTSKKKRVRSPGLQNPAALRRQALLHAAAKRLRRKRATAKRLRDAERWEAGKTSKQQKALAAQEAALPNISVIPE